VISVRTAKIANANFLLIIGIRLGSPYGVRFARR
jgi:hypothetical protein